MAHPGISRLAILAILFSVGSQLSAQFPQIPGLGKKADNTSALDNTQIASGLKEALSVGTKKAVTQVAKPGGYLENEAIKILLPPNLRSAEKVLRAAGQGPKIDDFIASMNHAAESAAPEAANIFAGAVKEMTIDDARKLLGGSNTAITDYFKSKTSTQLSTAFRPHVEAAMSKNGVTQKYQALAGQAPKLPFLNSSNMDINTYVVNKALDGLFYMLGQQEQQIRTNPAARSTALLKQVFGSR
ncbi:MAG: DUF4197 domain-containing protein [Acidobacteriaceae bacterium]|nr:DUF4197 domain-containing protein [Acidobacteriaceae bacterium]